MSKSYLAKLRAASEEENLRHDEEVKAQRKPTDTRILCDKPLADQIESLMRSLPPVQRDRPWSMDELVARLHGRYSARPHPMHVGAALRQLGWKSSRNWSEEGGGRRYWETQFCAILQTARRKKF